MIIRSFSIESSNIARIDWHSTESFCIMTCIICKFMISYTYHIRKISTTILYHIHKNITIFTLISCQIISKISKVKNCIEFLLMCFFYDLFNCHFITSSHITENSINLRWSLVNIIFVGSSFKSKYITISVNFRTNFIIISRIRC